LRELNGLSVTKWQSKWDQTIKCAITKSFFPKIADSLKFKMTGTPKFTTMLTGHGNFKPYVHKHKKFSADVDAAWGEMEN
jgi:hypothetical protein